MIVNVKHSVVSIAGVVLSQAANFIAVILIGKFCGPSELGYFSQLNAIGLFAGSVLGLRLEVACMAADKTLAVRALVSSSCVAMAIALLLFAVAVISGEQKYLTVVVLASGVFLQQALSSALASERKYVSIAVQRAFPNVAFAVAFVVLMMVASHPWSGPNIFAVYSFVFFASAAVPLAGYLFTSRSMLSPECLKFSRLQLDYAKFSLPTTSLNSVVIYSIAILMPLAFAPHDAGVFALAYRVGYFPASLLSQSLGAVFRRDLIDLVERGANVRVARNPATSFSLVLMPLSVVLIAAGYLGLALIINFKMGDLWQQSMHVYMLFSPYFLTMAVFGSLAQVFIVFKQQKFDLVIQLMSAVSIFIIFAFTSVFKLDFMSVVLLLSLSGTLVACVGIYYSVNVAKGGMSIKPRDSVAI
ncbi:hypothetical protein PQQ65_01310 [Paraburkholderia strydomiana]|uniref:hypothetical protein n=1 Tax=Paraburkholderia strydomiana TaxID=1245417 RepID=UPI0038B6E00D